MGFFTMGIKNVFEIAVVNEPSVFEPLKFYCIYIYTGPKKLNPVLIIYIGALFICYKSNRS